MRHATRRFIVISLGAASVAFACSEQVRIGRDLPLAAAGSGNSSGSTAAGGSAPEVCRIAACQGKVYQCGDCQDNDADGLTDSADSQCTGPCDNTEDSFYGGIPGQNKAPCHEDCYFDQDTGSGNDRCYWGHECDPLAVAPGYPPSGEARCAYDPDSKIPGTESSCSGLEAAQNATCLAYCGPLTPNGCDAFGCCELPAGSKRFVWIGSAEQGVGTCSDATLDDPAACHPCTPVASTFNACDDCEVCVGRTSPLASCSSGSDARCATGSSACGRPDEPACAPDEYCITGCCELAPR